MTLVELSCAGCGQTFRATIAGARAGRKWCSGTCQDRHKPFNARRSEYWKEYAARRRQEGRR